LYQQFKCIINLRISDYYVCGVGVDQATKLRRVMTEEKFSHLKLEEQLSKRREGQKELSSCINSNSKKSLEFSEAKFHLFPRLFAEGQKGWGAINVATFLLFKMIRNSTASLCFKLRCLHN